MRDVLPTSGGGTHRHPQDPVLPGGVSRRGLLAAGAAAVVAAGAGGAALGLWRELQERPPGAAEAVPLPGSVRVERGTFVSAHRGLTGFAVIHPPGEQRPDLPVVLALHGLGGNHDILLGPRYQLDGHLGDAVRDGVRPFRIVTVDAGRSYYHPHDGEDAGAMVLEELLPRLAGAGLATAPHQRIGLMGWSMGGYGALRLAGMLGPERVSTVCAISPALWLDPAEASVHGFDGPAEYRRFSVMGRQRDLDGIPVRVDCGLADPFLEAAQAYAAGFDRPVETSWEPGGHVAAYWRRMLPSQLSYVGSTLGS